MRMDDRSIGSVAVIFIVLTLVAAYWLVGLF